MLLVLRIQFYRNAPASLLPPGRFSETGGTIGRSPGNDLVLDDPGKSISRTHARILFRDGQFYLADVGSNPSVVNDRPLGNGRELALRSGDRIAIGEYQLEAQVEAPSADVTFLSSADPLGLGAPTATPAVASPAAPQHVPDLPLFEPPPRQPVSLPPLDAFGSPQQVATIGALPPSGQRDAFASASILNNPGSGNQFGSQDDPLGLNLFGASVADGAAGTGIAGDDPLGLAFRGSASDHAAPERIALPAAPVYVLAPAPASVTPFATGGIPDDYDPMDDFFPKPSPVQMAPPPPPPPQSPVPPVGTGPAASLPDFDFLAPPAPAPAAVSAPLAAQVREPVSAQVNPPASAPLDSPAAATPPLQWSIAPDAPGHATATPAPPAAGNDPTLEALLRGLGLPNLQTKHSGPALAELAGAMLREATGGAMQTLMARSVTKRESRIEMTMIASQANNPLKFFPDPASALNQMLSQTSGGYMRPVRAFGNAFEDLQAHELAVMAGMRAALATVLGRFDPAAIEKRLAVPTVMDKMMASSRKAKMWDRLVELYADISREADDDFQRLFGESFAKAYEDQIDRLHCRGK